MPKRYKNDVHGAVHESRMALKLLAVVKKKGFEVVA